MFAYKSIRIHNTCKYSICNAKQQHVARATKIISQNNRDDTLCSTQVTSNDTRTLEFPTNNRQIQFDLRRPQNISEMKVLSKPFMLVIWKLWNYICTERILSVFSLFSRVPPLCAHYRGVSTIGHPQAATGRGVTGRINAQLEKILIFLLAKEGKARMDKLEENQTSRRVRFYSGIEEYTS